MLLPTPPRGDAVTLGYRPENVYLERTCTSWSDTLRNIGEVPRFLTDALAWMTPSAGHPCSAAMGKCVLWSGAAVGEGVLWSSKFSGRTVFFAQSNRSAVGE